MTACKMALSGKYITQFGRYMIIYGGVDGKSHVLTLIYKRCKYQVSKCKERSALADVSGIHMVLGNGHGSLCSSGLNFNKINAYVLGELVAFIKEIFKCHVIMFGVIGCKSSCHQ